MGGAHSASFQACCGHQFQSPLNQAAIRSRSVFALGRDLRLRKVMRENTIARQDITLQSIDKSKATSPPTKQPSQQRKTPKQRAPTTFSLHTYLRNTLPIGISAARQKNKEGVPAIWDEQWKKSSDRLVCPLPNSCPLLATCPNPQQESTINYVRTQRLTSPYTAPTRATLPPVSNARQGRHKPSTFFSTARVTIGRDTGCRTRW